MSTTRSTLNPKIKKSPSAELYVKRGDLYRLDENYKAALADFERAENNPHFPASAPATGSFRGLPQKANY